jgi:cytochrome c oxidase assembly protein subunit 15
MLILLVVSLCAWKARTTAAVQRLGFFWLGLILVQVGLGAWTIWSNKAADVATAHVVIGALSLVTGALGCLISLRRLTGAERSAAVTFTKSVRSKPVSV